MGRVTTLLAAVVLVCLLAGCGGGGGPKPGPQPPPRGAGEITGRITGVSDPGSYTLTVDGQPVDVRPGPNGEFTIPGVPPGNHTVGCIGPGGMRGAYAPVTVRRGQRSSAGNLRPRVGGQIAGMVTRVLDGGALEPVANVEVIATSSGIWMPGPDDSGPISVGRNGDPDQIVISAFTDETGSYLMKAVPPGAYDVTVVVPGYDPQIQFVYVDPGMTSPADFMLYPAPEQGVGTVSGVVTGQGEGPLEGAQVTISTDPWTVPVPCATLERWLDARPGDGGIAPPCDPGDPNSPIWIETQVFTTLTDANGGYSLNVPVGTHWIECWLDGWDWDGREVTVEKNETTTVNFRLSEWDPTEPVPLDAD